MKILGISAYYHDSAAALICDGDIVACAQEERFTRKKQDPSFPSNAIQYCLKQGGGSVDYVVFYDKPLIKFERLLETYMAFAPNGFKSFNMAMPLWMTEKANQRELIARSLSPLLPNIDPDKQLLFSEHHLSHAASAFFPSPFSDAAILTMDGVGEWDTTSLAVGAGNNLKIEKEIKFPHSIGLLYAAFTYYTGFKINSGEYKVMGLAPYGEPKYAQKIFEHLIDIKPDGSFWLNMKYFDYCTGLTMTNKLFDELFGMPRRSPEAPLTNFHMDIAASIQAVTEEIVLRMARSAVTDTGQTNLCLAGGVALNCVANGKLIKDGKVKNLWVQPASGDAGGALGAALAAYYLHFGNGRVVATGDDSMKGAYLGPDYSPSEIESALKQAGAIFESVSDDELMTQTADALSRGLAVGWFQGRMEFGPRSLGGRSILGDPRSPSMQKTLNLKVKYRESFRPFAPAVLSDHASEWFDLEGSSPYMLIVADVKEGRRIEMSEEQRLLFGIDKLNIPRSDIPAVTHVDYSARIQTVDGENNPRFHKLLSEFYKKTGCPILINTSFNVRGEPIVNTPEDAFRCFMGTEMDFLAIGNCILRKEKQNQALKLDYSSAFELD